MENLFFFVCLLALAWTGHFALVLISHNWFYGHPFPRVVGDLIQGFHFAIGLIGLPLVFVGVCHLVDSGLEIAGNGGLKPLPFYAMVSIFICLVLLPLSEINRGLKKKFCRNLKCESRILDYSLEERSPRKGALALPWNESLSLEIREVILPLQDIHPLIEGLEILHISDTHFGGNDQPHFFCGVFQECLVRRPDFVFFTGDLVDSPEFLRWVVPLLGPLKANLGKFAVRGNHDFWNQPDSVNRALRKSGFINIQNTSEIVLKGNVRIGICGNESPWNKGTVGPPNPDVGCDFKILLTHTPDMALAGCGSGYNLAFCGHVHGGQIRVPFFGPLVMPSIHGRTYDQGFFREKGTVIHISRGLAGSFPYRVNCRPEITYIKIVKG